MGDVYRRPESDNLWLRYRDEDGRLRRVSSHTDHEDDAREQLRLIETQVRLKKRARKAAELMQATDSAGNGADQPGEDGADTAGLEARVAYLEHRVKALERLVHEVLLNAEEE